MVELADIRACLEGAVPSTIATCDLQGTPNVSYVSQVHYIDDRHVALTFQFFNKTHHNIRENPQATVYVTDPDTAAQYRLILLFKESRTHGTLFNALKAKLAGIAALSRMSDVFVLRGVDIYQVLDIQSVVAGDASLARATRMRLPALRALVDQMRACSGLAALFDQTVNGIADKLAIEQVSLLMMDERGTTLYSVASTGFRHSGIGAEVPVGIGIIGLCAQDCVPIRIAFGASEYSYRNAIAHYSRSGDAPAWLETEIAFPELPEPSSQLAVPLVQAEQALGVIYVESAGNRRFTYEDEDALAIVASQFVSCMRVLADVEQPEAAGSPSADLPPPQGAALKVRYYAANHSIFLDHDYLIKGVAGAILWRILQHWQCDGRVEFSNRELRLDPGLGLPELGDNLEARLVLLQKRLYERSSDIAIEKCGRGRFRLCLTRPVELEQGC